jgi:hypothetical protein
MISQYNVKTLAGDTDDGDEIAFRLTAKSHVAFDQYSLWHPDWRLLFLGLLNESLDILPPQVALPCTTLNEVDKHDVGHPLKV